MAVIADQCPELKINVVDINIKRIEEWNDPVIDNLPIFEPGLSEIIERCRNKIFSFLRYSKTHI